MVCRFEEILVFALLVFAPMGGLVRYGGVAVHARRQKSAPAASTRPGFTARVTITHSTVVCDSQLWTCINFTACHKSRIPQSVRHSSAHSTGQYVGVGVQWRCQLGVFPHAHFGKRLYSLEEQKGIKVWKVQGEWEGG